MIFNRVSYGIILINKIIIIIYKMEQSKNNASLTDDASD